MAEVVSTIPASPVNAGPERWLPAPGWPGYRVSDRGGVQSRRGRNGMKLPPGQWHTLKPVPDGHGYPQVRLVRGKKGAKERRWFGVHQLVLLAFVGPPPDGQLARHVDTNDPTDNRLDNLAYGTQAQNCQDKERHGTAQHGEKPPRAKLTQADVYAIRYAVKVWPHGSAQQMLAKLYGVTPHTICAIVHGKSWKCAFGHAAAH